MIDIQKCVILVICRISLLSSPIASPERSLGIVVVWSLTYGETAYT
jgi:hypothetical protein